MMRILAPFDQSHMSQATIPLLCQLASSVGANVEVTLVSVANVAHGTAFQHSIRDAVTVTSFTNAVPVRLPEIEPRARESRSQSVERVLERLHEYLLAIAERLPSGTRVNTEAYAWDSPRLAIHESALRRRADMIVMTRRSRGRGSHLTSHLLFGSTAEAILASGVAPILIVRSRELAGFDRIIPELRMTRRARLGHDLPASVVTQLEMQ